MVLARPPLSRSGLAWLALSLLLLIADLITKQWAIGGLQFQQPIAVLPGLNWNLTHNYGAAFSFLHDQSGWQRWFFFSIAVLVSGVLLVWLRRLPRGAWNLCVPLCLIVSGAIGNAIDRIRFGYVVDFIQVYYQQWAWPTFNIADSAISVGAVMLVLYELGWLGKKLPEEK